MADWHIEQGMMPDDDEPIRPVRCKFCGRENYEWEYRDGSWRLVTIETRRIHQCAKSRKPTHA